MNAQLIMIGLLVATLIGFVLGFSVGDHHGFMRCCKRIDDDARQRAIDAFKS